MIKSSTQEIIDSGMDFLGKKSIKVDKENCRIVKEKIFKKEYYVLKLPLKKESYNNNAEPIYRKKSYKLILDSDSMEIISSKPLFKKKMLNRMLWVTFFIPYPILCFFFFFLKPLFIIALPFIFGFIIYYMAYNDLKDYLKKLADTVTFFSGAFTACIAIGRYYNSPITSLAMLKNPYMNITISISLLIFSFFACIKLYISIEETIAARGKYLSDSSSLFSIRNHMPKTKIFFHKFMRRISNILSFIYLK